MDAVGVSQRNDVYKMPLDRRKSTSSTGDGDQGDTCRICRGEGTIDQPLFYPCKCSGSIKFVHQECLMEWLSHSQKKYCELCKTPFRFTKLYDQSMPATLPLPLFLRQIGVHGFKTLGRWVRYVFVTFVWTCWLPWSIRQIWRGLFWLADGSWLTAYELKQLSSVDVASAVVNTTVTSPTSLSGVEPGHAQTLSNSYFDPLGELFNLLTGAPLLRGLLRLLTTKSVPPLSSAPDANATTAASPLLPLLVRQPSLLSNVSSLNSLTKYQLVNNGFIDILEGQLICLSVIAAFILVFLIREWVINQQPILNMPNPDQAEAQPAAAQPNDDARQPARRRRRGFRRLPDRDVQLDNHAVQIAQRPIATPRRRRAATDEDVTIPQSAGQAFEQATVPPRSSSLVPGPTGTGSMFHMDTDDEVSWHPREWSEGEDLEAPPLQRGMFDEVVDIRRNIEERTTALPNDSDGGRSGHVGDGFLRHGNEPYVPSVLDNDYIGQNRLQRTDFVFGQNALTEDARYTTTSTFSFSSPLGTGDTQTVARDDRIVQTEQIPFEGSDSPWEGLNILQNEDSRDSSIDTPQSNNTGTAESVQGIVQTVDQESLSDSVPELANTEDDVLPETLLGRIAKWMWHTDERIRVQDQAIRQHENEVADNAHGGGHLRPAGNANAAIPVREPANAPAHEPNVQFGIDLNDANALDDAEDLEGILELIGMEGPLAGMIQNIIFSVFLITLTLSASVWCPYIWGKIAILIMSNPIGVFFKAPLFFVSNCGNILVDIVLFVGGLVGFGLSNLTKLVRSGITPALPSVAAHIKVAAVENWAYGISQNSGTRLEKALSGTLFGLRPDLPTFSMQSHHALRVFRQAFVEASSAISTDLLDTAKKAINLWHSHGLLGLPVFLVDEIVAFPAAALSTVRKTGEWWQVLTDNLRMRPLSEVPEHDFALVEWTTEDKILAILVGYAFFAAAGFAYLKIVHAVLGLDKGEKVDGMFADSLRQAGGVLKVIIIIGIEMIAFPLYCGLLLDCALLPLFKNATFQSRLGFLMSAPVTCLFIHWFVGTCYMFHFALFVSMCRKIMRKGVLYFIRDPDDPTFHPVRDVLERPVATQLGKIAFSAFVYGGLVIVCLGGVVWIIGSINGVLPIQWATNEPRLAFPVDIIFYNFMLPLILRRAELSKKVSAMYEWWFRQCAKSLRLSHFLFGEEREDEKRESKPFWRSTSTSKDGISTTLAEGQKEDQVESLGQGRRNGRYVRVPAADSVRIPKGTKVFVEVNENNERIDGEPDRDTGMHGRKDDRFVKIYVPPQFRARMSAFVFLVWFFAASTGAAFTVVPLLAGRQLIRYVAASTSAPNDLYAFTVGMHVCSATAFVGYMGLSRKDELREKASDILMNTKESLPRLYQVTKHIGGLVYLFLAVFVVLPFTTSLLTELYVHMPIYSYFANSVSAMSPTKTASGSASLVPFNPTIFILQTWTLGLLYLRLALRIAISYPTGQNRPSTALRAITRNGYLHPDIALASRALVFPALALCAFLLVAPLGLARLMILITGTVKPEEKLQLYRYSYPVLLGMAISVYLAVGLQHKIQGWRIKVRDEVYLVGERLHNFTDVENGKGKKSVKVEVDKGKTGAVQSAVEAVDSRTDTENTQAVGHQFAASERAVASGSTIE